MSEPIQSFREFLRELRRRSVYKVAVAYLVAGFVVVQLADLATGAFGLPSWFEPMVWVVCGLGFPLALILAWAFEVTPEGMRRTAEQTRGLESTPQRDRPGRLTGSDLGLEGVGEVAPYVEGERRSVSWLSDPRTLVLLGTLLLFAVGSGWLLVDRLPDEGSGSDGIEASPVIRFQADTTLTFYPGLGAFDISPDGSQIVLPSGTTVPNTGPLKVVNLDGSATRILRGTEGGSSPVFSPDGLWIAYRDVASRGIYRIPVDGGPAQRLADLRGDAGFAVLSQWDDAGVIYYSDDSGSYRLRDRSEPNQILSEGVRQVRWVRSIPGKDAILYTRHDAGTDRAEVRVLSLSDGTEKTVVRNGFDAFYAPTGHVVYARFDRSVAAVPFDVQSLEVVGIPQPIMDSVAIYEGPSEAVLAVSKGGIAVYAKQAPPESPEGRVRLARVDTTGSLEVLPLPAAPIRGVSTSHDGRTLAYVTSLGGGELHLYDLITGSDRIADDGGPFINPVWAPDGSAIAYRRQLEIGGAVRIFPVESDDDPDTVTTNTEDFTVESWHSDGRLGPT